MKTVGDDEFFFLRGLTKEKNLFFRQTEVVLDYDLTDRLHFFFGGCIPRPVGHVCGCVFRPFYYCGRRRGFSVVGGVFVKLFGLPSEEGRTI